MTRTINPTSKRAMTQKNRTKGDKVIYGGVAAMIDDIDHVAGYPDMILYSLISLDNPEMTCSALAKDCEDYIDDFDSSEALNGARINSAVIARNVDSITDKYYRDGNH